MHLRVASTEAVKMRVGSLASWRSKATASTGLSAPAQTTLNSFNDLGSAYLAPSYSRSCMPPHEHSLPDCYTSSMALLTSPLQAPDMNETSKRDPDSRSCAQAQSKAWLQLHPRSRRLEDRIPEHG